MRLIIKSIIGIYIATSILAVTADSSAQSRDRAAAAALFKAGRKAMKEGDYQTACTKFEESQRYDPAAGTLLNLANCKEKLGLLATAWELFDAAVERLPAGDNRIKIAQKRRDAIKPRLPYLKIELEPAAPLQTQVTRDGIEVGSASFGLSIPVDPGEHQVVVKAEGHQERRYEVALQEGEQKTLKVAPGEIIEPEEPEEPKVDTQQPVSIPEVDDGIDTLPEDSLSHAGQLGVELRSDIDPVDKGVIAAVGSSYGIIDYVEVQITALLGNNFGVEPGGRFYILKEQLKPLIELAVPIFFVDGARPGIRGSAGLQWDIARHIGVFAEAGVAFFPGDHENYRDVVFLPALGAQGRL
jgi:hypothetical protein